MINLMTDSGKHELKTEIFAFISALFTCLVRSAEVSGTAWVLINYHFIVTGNIGICTASRESKVLYFFEALFCVAS